MFENWLNQTEDELWKLEFIKDIQLSQLEEKIKYHANLQSEIKSRNSRVSSIIQICDRLKNDGCEQVPLNLASDLENRWHQAWLNSVEIQCKLEERLKFLRTLEQ
ncbi:unnamed protein product, partial [Didymodactylos carnosus]